MAPGLVGWDWFSLQLDDGWEVMLYLLRHQDGSVDPASSGTLIDPQGHARHLNLADFTVKPTGAWTSPHSQAKYPGGLGDHYSRGRLPPDAHPHVARPGDPVPGPGPGDLLGRPGQDPGRQKRRPGRRPRLRRTHRLRRRPGGQVLKGAKRGKGEKVEIR